MRVCDRCGPKRGIKAVERIYIETEGTEIDLCSECFNDVLQYATTIPKRKNKTTIFNRKTQQEIEVH